MRGILKQKKIGHTGTLDPDAVGVLPVCLGTATRLCDMLTDRDKEYIAAMRLGLVTDTQDITGTVLEERKVTVGEEEVRKAAASYVGEYAQLPPMYSAIKVNGKRLYELARQGKEVERKPRTIQIYEIEIVSLSLPELSIRVHCSKGTYIRTLCHDIGQTLGCGGVMTSLERTRSGRFTKEGAVTLKELEKLRDSQQLDRVLIPVDNMFEELGSVHVLPDCVKLVNNGNSFYSSQIAERRMFDEQEEVRVYDRTGRFYGVYVFHRADGKFTPRKMFLE
jgi:tRNA pseudouridine55 synthase